MIKTVMMVQMRQLVLKSIRQAKVETKYLASIATRPSTKI